MTTLPYEIRLGEPDEAVADDPSEFQAVRYDVRRDANDTTATDVRVVLDLNNHRALRAYLEGNPNAASVTLIFDAPNGLLPPDPMGPAIVACNDFLSSVAAASERNDVLPGDFYNAAATLYADLRAAVYSGAPTAKTPFPEATKPAYPTTLSGIPMLETMITTLIDVAYEAAHGDSDVWCGGTGDFTEAGFSKTLALVDTVKESFAV
ncbi:MAG TPA: hypothetical protein VGU66_15905 [Candidatus Elarobacter sp.]|nr:hypothetical protein [Candidatus Elarobacter sp.]